MVLADPGLGVIVHVQPLHQLEVALHAQERVFVVRVERRQEDPGPQCAEPAHRATPLRQGLDPVILSADGTGALAASTLPGWRWQNGIASCPPGSTGPVPR